MWSDSADVHAIKFSCVRLFSYSYEANAGQKYERVEFLFTGYKVVKVVFQYFHLIENVT